MIRVAQLTKYGPLAASTRQRFHQYQPYLAAAGCDVELWPLLSDEYLSGIYSGNGRDPRHILSGYADRAKRIFSSENVDLLWVHCEVFPYLPSIFESLIQLPKKPIVFDYDDAVFHNYDLHRNSIVRMLLGGKLKSVLSAAEIAFCGNKYLENYARKYCRATEIVPTVLNTETFSPGRSSSNRAHAQIGWIGTPSTWAEYMAPMMPILASVSKAEGARIAAVGAGKAAPPHPLLDNLPWSEETEVARIQDMDIGIMPLTDAPWARGKCGYKLIQYMACGLPVIASPVGVNAEIVEHGVNGFLATTEAEWREALVTLLGNQELRRRMGAEGRRKVETQYSLQAWGPRVAGMLKEVVERGRLCSI
ncbi:MAG: glycosyltransferase family 4 protein [Methylocystis sp.]